MVFCLCRILNSVRHVKILLCLGMPSTILVMQFSFVCIRFLGVKNEYFTFKFLVPRVMDNLNALHLRELLYLIDKSTNSCIVFYLLFLCGIKKVIFWVSSINEETPLLRHLLFFRYSCFRMFYYTRQLLWLL